jgi:hypothetical protein
MLTLLRLPWLPVSGFATGLRFAFGQTLSYGREVEARPFVSQSVGLAIAIKDNVHTRAHSRLKPVNTWLKSHNGRANTLHLHVIPIIHNLCDCATRDSRTTILPWGRT